MEHGRVITLQRTARRGFLAQWHGKEVAARTVLLATGLVDESPDIEGLDAAVYGERFDFFLLICDGFEAMDRRIGGSGAADEAGQALFLRSYSRQVLLRDGQKPAGAQMRQTLTQADIERPADPCALRAVKMAW